MVKPLDSSSKKSRTPHLNRVVDVFNAVITLICCLPSRSPSVICHLKRRPGRLLHILLLQGAELEVRLVPLSAEGDTWVEQGQRNAGNDDHGTLEDHKCEFIVCKCAVETLVEFYGAEDGSHEDGDGGDGEAWVVLARHSRGVVVDGTYRRGKLST